MYNVLWLGLALTTIIPLASCYDPNISNGTCYFGNGQQAADSFIPCGNAAGGVKSCCQARDICLSSNACFNSQYFVTYLAGCTDESYSDSACPNKGAYADQQWAGLVRCFVSNGTSGEEWAPCQEPDTTEVNAANTQCTCDPASSTAAFTDGATLTDIASLPVRTNNDIAWYSGFTPSTGAAGTTTTDTGSTTTGQSGSDTTTTAVPGTAGTSSNPTPSSTPSSSDTTSLSAGAKAGIGVGSAAGALVIGALLLWLLWFRRRNKQAPPIEDQIRPHSGSTWGGAGPNQMSEQYAGWGAKSELPTDANEIQHANDEGQSTLGTNGLPTPATSYQPYHRSSATEPSEMDASPAASSSALVPGGLAHEKEKRLYDGQVFEMPA